MAEQADPAPHRVALGGQVVAEHVRRPAGERQQAGAQPQQRGLAGAVRASQQHDLAALHLEVGARERGEVAQHRHHLAEGDNGLRRKCVGGHGVRDATLRPKSAPS